MPVWVIAVVVGSCLLVSALILGAAELANVLHRDGRP